MQTTITARHGDVSDELRARAEAVLRRQAIKSGTRRRRSARDVV